MVLLDDSNSYWWLVRIVKDGSIGEFPLLLCTAIPPNIFVGYLPAEHIETPTERLARLNKHRNIDVSNLPQRSYGAYSKDFFLFLLAFCDNARRQSREVQKSSEKGNAPQECKDCDFRISYVLRSIRCRLLV